METNVSSDQLIDLEMRIAHQERAIEVLEDTVFTQQKSIDALEAKLAALAQKLAESDYPGREMAPGNEKPPHY